MGGKNQTATTNSSQSYTPTGLSQLNDIWNKVQGVASTPYNPYGGQLTAGLDPTQQAGINTINSAQGTAQPYYDQATQYANQAAAPISASQIQNYQSPYTQQVVNAAQNQFNDSNAQQLQQVRGNAALQGALGGSRSAVAEAETARQQKLAQDPTIAGLYNQGYTQALGAAQQDRAAQAQAAYSLGSLGSAAQNTAISGGNAQLGAGAVAQGTNQAGLSAAYQQYLQQQAFPYQQAQFLASYGLPAATAQGGTQTGNSQTTQPGPSPWGQAAGIGLAGLSFLKDGGRVEGYASGGSPMGAENFILVPSYIPKSENAPQAQTPQMAPMQAPSFKPQGALAGPSPQAYADGLSSIGGLFGGSSDGWQGGTPLEGGAAPWQGGIGHAARGGRINEYANGGFVDSFNSIHRALGGTVTPSPFARGYDSGGGVPASAEDLAMMREDVPLTPERANMIYDAYQRAGGGTDVSNNQFVRNSQFGISPFGQIDANAYQAQKDQPEQGSGLLDVFRSMGNRLKPIKGYAEGGAPDFASRWQDIDAANDTFNRPATVASPLSVLNADTLGLDKPVNWSPAQQNAPQLVADGATPQTIQAADLPPPTEVSQQPSPYTPTPAMSVAATDATPVDDDGTVDLSAQSKQTDSKSGLLGLGLSKEARMGLLSAGLGALSSRSPFALSAIGEGGLKGLETYTGQKKESADREIKKQSLEQQAARLAQSASQFATTSGETKRYHDILDQGRKDASADKQTRSGYMKNADGTMSIIKGGPADPEVISAGAKAKASATDQPNLSDSAIKRGVEQMLVGDYSIKQNLGRGRQGAANLTALENAMADEMDKRNMTGAQRAAVNSNFKAQTAAMKTAAVREANVSASVEEAKNTFPLALKASSAVPRTQFVPWNTLVQKVQSGTSNKELAQLYTATQGAITAYAQAMARTGVMTVDGRHAAEALLRTATSQETYEAIIGQMAQEMKAAEAAPETVRHAIMSRISGSPPPASENTPQSAPSVAPNTKQLPPGAVRQGGHVFAPGPDGKMQLIE